VPTREEITGLLREIESGDARAIDRLMPIVYAELRALAHAQLRRAPDQTLNTTGLVHEAYLKLIDQNQVGSAGRRQFFQYAATTMRNILVDNARRRLADKRGGGAVRDDDGLDALPDADTPQGLLAVDQALNVLKRCNARLCEVVELHLFAGLGFAEIADCLAVTERTVFRDWHTARVMLGGLLAD
jgi:RNA polymerase sigma factor (TIGR02999 family)